MTQAEIISMAREALLPSDQLYHSNLVRFAALIAAAEREACAKLAQETVCDTHIPTGIQIYGTKVAKAIRARNL